MKTLSGKFITAFLISLLVFVLSASVIGGALLIGRGEKYTPPSDGGGSKELSGSSFNVLLIMTDYAPEKFNDYDPESVKNIFGTDVAPAEVSSGLSPYRKIYAEDMALLRFDKERGDLTYTHIPGNTFVKAKGDVKMRLEEVAAVYGTEYLVSKVHAIVGVEIDSYILFTPQTAKKALDSVGEITYTVQCDMNYQDPERGLDINIKAGSQKLDGASAVNMLRFENYGQLGVTRSETACGYLKRFVNKLAGDFTYDEIGDIIDTSLSQSNVVSFSYIENREDAIKLLSCGDELDVKDISLVGQMQTVDGEKYFRLDEEATLEKFKPYRRINAPENIWD